MNGPAEGYTAVLCGAASCRTDDLPDTATALRDCVRTSRHGVMVAAGCTFGPLGCRLRPTGPVVVVQPCDPDRRPVGRAVRIGPLLGPADVASVRDWISGHPLDPDLLPPHLVALDRRMRNAGQN